jgi:hypothetical protein
MVRAIESWNYTYDPAPELGDHAIKVMNREIRDAGPAWWWECWCGHEGLPSASKELAKAGWRRHQQSRTALKLSPLGQKPRRTLLQTSWRNLRGAHDTVQGILDAYALVHAETQLRRAESRGRLRRDEQDLLRAALVFSGAGLDACLRQLMRDVLPTLIDRHGNAAKAFRTRRSQWLARPENGGRPELIKKAILAEDPRAELVMMYVEDLTKSSLQKTSQLKKVRSALGLDTEEISDESIEELQEFLHDQNGIVHELDYRTGALARGNSTRVGRTQKDVVEACDKVISLCRDIVLATALQLNYKTKEPSTPDL